MKISICSNLFDYNGAFLLDYDHSKSQLSFLSRRVSRTATLDGKATIVDNGYTASDATLIIALDNIDYLTKVALVTMIKIHSLITVSVNSDIFLGVVDTVQETDTFKIKFLVKEQLNG